MNRPPRLASRRLLLQAAVASTTALAAPRWLRAQSAPWLIGQTAALSGPLAYPFVEMNKGIQAAFDEANERGGVDGRPLELRSLDDAGEPPRATENARPPTCSPSSPAAARPACWACCRWRCRPRCR
jgi:branched-chain amino acid transport system substrate-binding protein